MAVYDSVWWRMTAPLRWLADRVRRSEVADAVTVAIPVRNGGGLLGEVLEPCAAQRVDRTVELLVADSGSTDGSRPARPPPRRRA